MKRASHAISCRTDCVAVSDPRRTSYIVFTRCQERTEAFYVDFIYFYALNVVVVSALSSLLFYSPILYVFFNQFFYKLITKINHICTIEKIQYAFYHIS